MTAPIPEWWVRARYKDETVYAGLEAPFVQRLVVIDGVVPYRYRGTQGERVYRTLPSRITVLDWDPIQLPDAQWADDTGGPRRGAGARASGARRADPPPPASDTRVEDLVRDLATARRRIVELEKELRQERARSRTTAAPTTGLPDLDELIQLCHPDRHPAARAELANRITAALLTAKRGQR